MFIKTKFFAAALAFAVCAGFASCSDDDDNKGNEPTPPTGENGTANPGQVFTQGMPASVNGSKITRDAQGRVTEILGTQSKVNFTYLDDARANDFNVVMTVKELYDNDVETFNIQLNKQGYASYAQETSSDSREVDEWKFTYTSDGYLQTMYRSEGRETTTLTWVNGNLVKVNTADGEDGTNSTATIAYGDQENKGAIMMFDDCFDIDMDEFAMAYYAGLLGKATAMLPISCTEQDMEVDIFTWTLDANGYPTGLRIDDRWGTPYNCPFTW